MDTPRLTLYVGRDCHLCEVAREQLHRLREEVRFDLEEVDITGVEELEARHRRWLPVLELDGRRLSVYRIDEDGLRRVLADR